MPLILGRRSYSIPSYVSRCPSTYSLSRGAPRRGCGADCAAPPCCPSPNPVPKGTAGATPRPFARVPLSSPRNKTPNLRNRGVYEKILGLPAAGQVEDVTLRQDACELVEAFWSAYLRAAGTMLVSYAPALLTLGGP